MAKVDSLHPDYARMYPVWEKMRDVIEGERKVKEAGQRYLPMLQEQEQAAYLAYKMRADFYPATQRTIIGLLGLIFRKPSTWTVPAAIEATVRPHFADVTLSGIGIEGFGFDLVNEMLSVGRGVVVVGFHGEANRPVWRLIAAEDVINWRTARNPQTGDTEFTLIVYRDSRQKKTDDPFDTNHENLIRVLRMDGRDFGTAEYPFGAAIEETYRERTQAEMAGSLDPERERWIRDGDPVELVRMGRLIPFLPVVAFNAYDMDPGIKAPPLESLADLNLSHYRTSADLEHGAHYVAMPTPWVTGYQATDKLYIGASSAITLRDPGARVGMLEFTGQGLGALEKRLETKERHMATIGARMLETRPRAAETAEALRMRQGEATSSLELIAQNASDVLSYVLWLHCWWISTTDPRDEEVTFSVNREFTEASLTSQELAALVAAWQDGAMSWDTLFFNMLRGGVVPAGTTADLERTRIDVEIAERAAPMVPDADEGDDV